jgi:hypothetical protein
MAAVSCAAPRSGAARARSPDELLVERGAPVLVYGKLDANACETELGRRNVPFTKIDKARGVMAPIRLNGPLRGVAFHTALPEAERATSPYEIVDCRLALALDDFANELSAHHDVVEVIHYSAYRPPEASWPDDKVAARHAGALAIDIASFVKRDGHRLDVLHDFHGRIGAHTCEAGSGPRPATPEALELRSIVCDATGAKLFNVALTPDFNRAHRNHFHLEVAADATYFFVH